MREYDSEDKVKQKGYPVTEENLKNMLDFLFIPGQGIQHASGNSEQQKDSGSPEQQKDNINNLLKAIIRTLESIEYNTRPPELDKNRA